MRASPTAGAAFASAIYRSMPDDQLAHVIGKLERMVRSLDRGKVRSAGYKAALAAAIAEQERRRAGA